MAKLMRTTTHVVVTNCDNKRLLTEHRSANAAEAQARAMRRRTDQKKVCVMTAPDFLAARDGEWTQEAAK